MKNYYQILGIKEGSSADDIRKAYRKLAKKYHPDVNNSPDAANTFIEINEAYEILMHKSTQKDKLIEPGSTEYQDLINRIREEAQRRARVKYEKLQREHEAFRESGLYDIGLVIKFIGLLLYPFIAIFLVFAPFYIAWYFKEPAAIAYLSFIWIIGGFLCYDIYQRRNHYFNLGGFYYNWTRIKQYFWQIHNTSQECFYCKGLPANSHPFAINIIHLKSIKLQNNGPLQHKVGYNRTEEKLLIPRSRKAFIVHSLVTILKILSIFAFVLFVPIDSGSFRIIGGFFTAWFVSFIVLLITNTRSKVGYMLSWAMIIKILIWIIGIAIISDFTSGPFNIITSEYLPFTIMVIMVFDVILEQVLKLPKKVNLFKPLLPHYKNFSGYFSKNNLLYLEVPFWTTIYPILRWLT